MKRSLLLAGLAAVSLAAPSAAQPNWSQAPRVTVALSSFKFAPATIRLRAGQPVILHLQNSGSGGHDFSAPAFFKAATVRPQDKGRVEGGSVDVAGRESVDVALVPAAGTYPLRCTHAFHSMFGMKGSIVVQ
ncbi:MAG: cupredoxin domain-containing protein [Alphaproteobacteria bacterium]|nr:cupredoxin domain-containing protein [Alphaproteobacteria bacterium]